MFLEMAQTKIYWIVKFMVYDHRYILWAVNMLSHHLCIIKYFMFITTYKRICTRAHAYAYEYYIFNKLK